MGLSETINTTTLLGTNTGESTSNNIDVHLMKTTEYGAMAILSASAYGNPSNERNITSTTGNETGVMINTNYGEGTAGGYSGAPFFNEKNAKYYDAYEARNNSEKAGDALGTDTTANPGCAGWHLAYYSTWVPSDGKYGTGYFMRGGGGIFSFTYPGAEQEVRGSTYYARGVAVCGTGL
ncbi:MAG: hypothetical protein HFJ28_02880 [Clostridia bacterium]|nr:hypothetical protein [Clostridia bacterium]